MNAATKQRRLFRRIFKGLAVFVMVGVIGVAAFLGSLRLEHRTDVTLPTPTGPFAVSRAIYDWKDDAAADALAPIPGTKRELLVWMWYPAATGHSLEVIDDYLPAPMRTEVEHALGPVLGEFLTRDLSKVHSHSIRNADVAPQQHSYPVVILRGGASAEVWNYSTLAEDLASHGYVVVGFDAPYRTFVVVFLDGRVIRRTPANNPELCLQQGDFQEQDNCVNRVLSAWTADSAFVLDRLERLNALDSSGKFTGRLDLRRVGVFGHSLGGATALQFCHEDPRCKAGIDVDGAPHGSVIHAGLHQPFLFLMSDHSRETDPGSRQIQANIQSIYNRLPADGRLRIAIRGANHFTFSDDGAVLKSQALRWLLRGRGKLGIDGRRQLAVTSYCVRSFFDAYLKGTIDQKLEISSPNYPEIQLLQ
jgi:pimeloyl-ACP methyl ester carboxylesterase